MRWLLDFYRGKPIVTAVVLIVGSAVAIAVIRLRNGDGVLLPLAIVLIAGIVLGAVISVVQRRRRS